MKYFSLVTEKIVTWSCGYGISICAHMGLALQILGMGLQFLYTQFVTQKLSMEQPVVQFAFPGHFPSSDNQSLMKLEWPCVVLMYIPWIHQSLPYLEHLSRGYKPKLCCLDPWAQCHVPVQKLYSWTKIVFVHWADLCSFDQCLLIWAHIIMSLEKSSEWSATLETHGMFPVPL